MATMVEDRTEVGTCDKGNVFIFHFASRAETTDALVNHQWRVVAGNHTIGTYASEAAATAVANALCGIEPAVEPETPKAKK